MSLASHFFVIYEELHLELHSEVRDSNIKSWEIFCIDLDDSILARGYKKRVIKSSK